MQTLREPDYDFATCTVDAGNHKQQQILAKAGWRPLQHFDNRKTGDSTQLWGWRVSP